MQRVLLSFIITLLSIQFCVAQVFAGRQAQEKMPGVDLVRYTNGRSLPAYVQLKAQNQAAESDRLSLLKNQLSLPASVDFDLLKTENGALGQTHYRYQQTVQDIPVYGAVYLIHCKAGKVASMNGHLFDQPVEMNPTPTLTPDEATAIALQQVPAITYAWEIYSTALEQPMGTYPEPQLVWVPKHLDYLAPEFRLAYQVEVYAAEPHERKELFIDAENGLVIAEKDLIAHVDEEGVAKTELSGEQTIIADRVAPGNYRLRESGRGSGIVTLNLQGNTGIGFAVDFEDNDNYWDNVNEQQDQFATDAHWATEMYFDYLTERHNRESIDGNGLRLVSLVHYGSEFSNAFWDGSYVYCGDGRSNATFKRPVVSPEVVAHEFTHGLIDHTANLDPYGESGALDEAFSDIFGVALDFYARPEEANWQIAEEVTSGVPIRNMSNPKQRNDPDTYLGQYYDYDIFSRHNNAGVINYWFYLLVKGGYGINDINQSYNLEGIGMDQAMQICYATLVNYLTPTSDFSDAAFYTSVVAAELFGSCSSQQFQVQAAWHAVGVSNYHVQPVIAAFEAPKLHCSTPATVAFTNQSTGLLTAEWHFGDGATSNELNPVHQYNEPGFYDVSLIIEGCAGLKDTLVRQNYILIDTTDTYCNVLQMPSNDFDVVSACSGVIVDPGGDGNYQNNESSQLFLFSENHESPIEFHVVEFNTAYCCDRLIIRTGADSNPIILAVLEGDDEVGRTIYSPYARVVFDFYSDEDRPGPGFVITFSDADGLGLPNASCEIDNTNPPLNYPVKFWDESYPGGQVTWDFGDSHTADEDTPVHAYSSPGTYTVQQIVSNCTGEDTAYYEITVQESGTLAVEHDQLNVELYSGQTLDTFAILQNLGPGDLYYEVLAPSAPAPLISEDYYVHNRDSTVHFFEGIAPNTEALSLQVLLNGDYDSDAGFASLYIDGDFVDDVNDGNPANGTDIIREYSFDQQQLANWVADGRLEIKLVNSIGVNPFGGGSNRHEVTIQLQSVFWLNIDRAEGILLPNESYIAPIQLDATGLLGGLYQTQVPIPTGDPDQETAFIEVNLTVIGIPELQIPDTIDFGEAYIGTSTTLDLPLTNSGTVLLTVSNINIEEPYFSSDTDTLDIPYLSTVGFPVTFAPLEAGYFYGSVQVQSNAGMASIPIKGRGVHYPEIQLNTDSVCVSVRAGSTASDTFSISNIGLGPLHYQVQKNEGFINILMLTYGGGWDDYVVSVKGQISELFNNFQLKTSSTTDIEKLEELLESTDLLWIPPVPEAFENTMLQFNPIIRNYISNGGGLLLSGYGIERFVITDFYFHVDHYDFSNSVAELEIQEPEHPLLQGVNAPIYGYRGTISLDPSTTIPEKLLKHPEEYWPLLSRKYGLGRVVFCGFYQGQVDGNVNQILTNSIQWATYGYLEDWLQVAPRQGSLEAMENQVFTLDFDASGLAAGAYHFPLIIASNDQDEPNTVLHVKMMVEPFPQAYFELESAGVSCDGMVSFRDLSPNNPTSWLWDFGDGQTSEEANPIHIYQESGWYDVQLIACNDLGCDTLTKQHFVEVELEDTFCESVVLGYSGTTYLEACSGTLYDIGGPDYNYTGECDIRVVIKPPGAHQVKLYFDQFDIRVSDRMDIRDGDWAFAELIGSYSQNSLEGTSITSSGGAITLHFKASHFFGDYPAGFAIRWECAKSPQAAFTAAPVGSCGNEVAFTNYSTSADQYLWDFGDGFTSETPSPNHFFGTAGTFPVTLTVSNDFDVTTHTENITIQEVPYDVSIDVPDTIVQNTPVMLQYHSSIPVEATWHLGNLGVPLDSQPMVTFPEPGNFDISLQTISADGCQVWLNRRIYVLEEQLNGEVDLKLFPNPTRFELNINLRTGSPSPIQMTWYNALGQKVGQRQFEANYIIEDTIDLSRLSPGIYWFVLKAENGWKTTKKVVVH